MALRAKYGSDFYWFKLIMARLISVAEGTISMAFLVMCAEKILRLLRLFLSYFLLALQFIGAACPLLRGRNSFW